MITIGALRPTTRRGNLSAALIAALRAEAALRDRADSLELVIVSPFAERSWTRDRHHPKAVARRSRAGESAWIHHGHERDTRTRELNANASDALRVTLSLLGQRVTGTGQQASGNGQREARAMIAWPASTRPRFAVPRAATDTVGGVMAASRRSSDLRAQMVLIRLIHYRRRCSRTLDGRPASCDRKARRHRLRAFRRDSSNARGRLRIRHEFGRIRDSTVAPVRSEDGVNPADPAAVAKLKERAASPRAPHFSLLPTLDRRWRHGYSRWQSRPRSRSCWCADVDNAKASGEIHPPSSRSRAA